ARSVQSGSERRRTIRCKAGARVELAVATLSIPSEAAPYRAIHSHSKTRLFEIVMPCNANCYAVVLTPIQLVAAVSDESNATRLKAYVVLGVSPGTESEV